MRPEPVTLLPLPDVPLIEPGDDLGAILVSAIVRGGASLQDDDILVVAQKIVSKAEGRYVALRSVAPSPRAIEIAARAGKDPRYVEVVLSQSEEVVKVGPHVVVAAHRLGFVMANAGIDESNIRHEEGDERVLLLPADPDGTARRLKDRLDVAFSVSIGVIVNDSFGRPWRNGVVGVALGAAGVPALVDRVGTPDLFGRKLKVTEIAFADEVASGASILMGQAAEGCPAVLVRGLHWDAPARPAAALIRPRERDMFR
jgi:coenzyme F420-0:L-glutamate ligase/coenzyme F420-1:gamma-L-glutamate ligase